MTTTDPDLISTGIAAKRLGYSPSHFLRKFLGVIPSRRLPGGYRKWSRAVVEHLADQARREAEKVPADIQEPNP